MKKSKKRFWCFKNKKHTLNERDSASDEKRGFGVSKIRNTPLKKGIQPPMRKEHSVFQK
jgi:hypothetical protein